MSRQDCLSSLQDTPSLPLASRGVYHLPWAGPAGERYLAAVSAGGVALYHLTVLAPEHMADAEGALWDLLDETDPPRQLRLIR